MAEITPQMYWSLMGDPNAGKRYQGTSMTPYLQYIINTHGGQGASQPTPEQLNYMYNAMYGGQPNAGQRLGMLFGGGPQGTSLRDIILNALGSSLFGR